MYKLLTTTAVILAVATPSFAWTGAKELIENLNTVYQGVDGGAQFTNLTNNGGELNNFLSDVDQGVTHISLKVVSAEDVVADNSLVENTIIPTLNEGKTLTEIQETAGDLVNRINYDLFHDATPEDADDDTLTGNYDSTADYTITNDSLTTKSYIDHTTDLANLGLVGNKVNDIVTDVDSFNTGLIGAVDIDGGKTAAEQNNDFIAAYNGSLDETHFGVNTKDFNEDITEINSSITAAGGSNFFGNTSGFAVDGGTLNNFAVTGFTFVDNGLTDGTNTYTTLLDWAEAQ